MTVLVAAAFMAIGIAVLRYVRRAQAERQPAYATVSTARNNGAIEKKRGGR